MEIWSKLNDLANLANAVGGTALSNFSVPAVGGFDGVGNQMAVTASGFFPGTTTHTYDYGQSANPQVNRSQLTQETSTRGSYTNTFSYDAGISTGPGNSTGFKGTSQTFNGDNQLTGTGMAYDGAGNPTTYRTKALTFDPENRLTSYGGTVQTNGYSGDGLRAWKQAGSTRTYFLYDDAQPIAEYNSGGTLLATNTFGADGLVSRRAVSSNVTTFYTFDERGSVSRRVKADGSILSSDLYDGYGSRSSTGAADVWQFEAQAGYYTDSETGLILCTHRFYDPQNGRWLTRDPVGYGGGINLYGYVGNDPVNADDPDGYASAKCKSAYAAMMKAYQNFEDELAKYDPVQDGIGGFPIWKGGKFLGRTKPGGHYKKLQNLKNALSNRTREYQDDCEDNDGNKPKPQPCVSRALAYKPEPPRYPVAPPRRFPPNKFVPIPGPVMGPLPTTSTPSPGGVPVYEGGGVPIFEGAPIFEVP